MRLNEEPAAIEIKYARDVLDGDNDDVLDPHHQSRANEEADSDTYTGPVDLDELFAASNLEAQRAADDGSLFSDDEEETQRRAGADQAKYFYNPHKRVSLSCVFRVWKVKK